MPQGKQRDIQRTEEVGESSGGRVSTQGGTSDVLRSSRYYSGKFRSKEAIKAYKGNKKHVNELRYYEKIHGKKIESIVQGIKDVNYSAGVKNSKQAIFVAQRSENRGEEGVLDPTGRVYMGERREAPVYVSSTVHRQNLERDRVQQRDPKRERFDLSEYAPFNQIAQAADANKEPQARFDQMWMDEHGSYPDA